MLPTRIRAATARVLRRANARALAFDLVLRRLAEEERMRLPGDDLAAALRDDDTLVLLEHPAPLAGLPLIVHEATAKYHAVLGATGVALAVVDTGELPGRTDEPDMFGQLAAPLFQAWRNAGADCALRSEIAAALTGLWTLARTTGPLQTLTR